MFGYMSNFKNGAKSRREKRAKTTGMQSGEKGEVAAGKVLEI